jgi:predicted nucleotidyltransferase component of viral defense system
MATAQSDILTKEQTAFLELVAAESSCTEHFYFTGGTALSAFYLHHRFSEDIDLFSEEEFDLLPIRAFIGKAQRALKLKKVDYRQYFELHTFELYFSEKNILKVDFSYYPFPRISIGERYGSLAVDSVLDIAVNKVHTIAMKPRARDFIDIYFIVSDYGYDLFDLLMKAKAKFDWHIDPLQLGSRLFEATEIRDLPRMIRKVEERAWRNFFVSEAEKLKTRIFE